MAWQAARRGLGTNLYRLGVPEKTIHAILRHANGVDNKHTDDTRLAAAKLERLVIGNADATTLQSRNQLATPPGRGPAALLQ